MSLSSTSCIALLIESCVTCLWISVIDNQSCCIEVLLSIMTFYLKTSIHLLHLFNLCTSYLFISYSSLTSLIFFSLNFLLDINMTSWALQAMSFCLMCLLFPVPHLVLLITTKSYECLQPLYFTSSFSTARLTCRGYCSQSLHCITEGYNIED